MATKNVRIYLKFHRKYAKFSVEERCTNRAIRLYDQMSTIWTNQLSSQDMDEIDAVLGQGDNEELHS